MKDLNGDFHTAIVTQGFLRIMGTRKKLWSISILVVSLPSSTQLYIVIPWNIYIDLGCQEAVVAFSEYEFIFWGML